MFTSNMVFQNTMPHYVFENIMEKQGKVVSHYANKKIMGCHCVFQKIMENMEVVK